MNSDMIKKLRNKYKPIPFWSWNEKLCTDETRRQARIMKEAGIGGYIMHARGGLQTEYMGSDWFDNIKTGVEEAGMLDMSAWAYDENGWPSGFGNGLINGLGEKFQQKYLRMEAGEKHTEHTICNKNGIHFYYEVNPFYVDNLDKDVVKRFIDEIYAPYYEKFGNKIKGFFTDEPQLSRNGIPWSLVLVDEYQKEYGEDLRDRLIELFKPEGEYKNTRVKFWRLITKLFSDSYCKQIYDWCSERGLKLTGHLVEEQTLEIQLNSNGAVMPHYEYFHIPGMDWLGRNISDPLTQLQVVSAALQTGKKQILTETFALCGHNVSFSELRRILEWQMVRGVNLFCQHLEGYSLRGIRKRDYPPAMNYQQPWWDEYKLFNESMSRVGMLIAEGKSDCKTLLIHPQTSAWICYDAEENNGINELNDKFIKAISQLESKHIQFHLGDEILMERHGAVRDNTLVIGEMEYTTVVLPPHIDFLENTKRLLAEFEKGGGRVITAEEAEDNPIVDNKDITYLKRCFDDFNMHYFVNSTEQYQNAKINAGGVKLDIASGEVTEFDKEYRFAPMDSLVVLDYKDGKKGEIKHSTLKALSLDGEWEITDSTENSLTLDYCDCYFDGEAVGENIPVTSIQSMACDLKRPVDIRCVFDVEVAVIPKEICLVCETPEIFEYRINGQKATFNDIGYFRDKSFRKSDISSYMKTGLNRIELLCHFVQSDTTYENIEKSKVFESEKNKLTYDMEIESVYLVGDFSVDTDGAFEKLKRNAVRYSGRFVIDTPKNKIQLKNIEQQGFPFFAGRMTIRKMVSVDDTNYKLSLNMMGINAVSIRVNHKEVETVIWNYSEVDLSGYLNPGENIIELTIVNNLRNLLGPHHLEEGESYFVGAFSFFKGNNMWSWTGEPEPWNDEYCFVETTLMSELN